MKKRELPPSLDPASAIERISAFLVRELRKTGREKVVLGVSGGVDSALAAALAVKALGKEKVVGIKMPYRTSNPGSEKDADLVIAKFGFKSLRVDISPIVDSYFKEDEGGTLYRVRKGNFMARSRMMVLFDKSALENGIVLGTGNRTEALLGYTTWYGDSACSVNPLGNLYKSQVYELARALGVPERIIGKAPSADLWAGQTDEKEMGFLYSEADPVLYLVVDEGRTVQEAAETLEIPRGKVEKIIGRVEANRFKRMLPPVAKMPKNRS